MNQVTSKRGQIWLGLINGILFFCYIKWLTRHGLTITFIFWEFVIFRLFVFRRSISAVAELVPPLMISIKTTFLPLTSSDVSWKASQFFFFSFQQVRAFRRSKSWCQWSTSSSSFSLASPVVALSKASDEAIFSKTEVQRGKMEMEGCCNYSWERLQWARWKVESTLVVSWRLNHV